jgi:hypothetical protein
MPGALDRSRLRAPLSHGVACMHACTLLTRLLRAVAWGGCACRGWLCTRAATTILHRPSSHCAPCSMHAHWQLLAASRQLLAASRQLLTASHLQHRVNQRRQHATRAVAVVPHRHAHEVGLLPGRGLVRVVVEQHDAVGAGKVPGGVCACACAGEGRVSGSVCQVLHANLPVDGLGLFKFESWRLLGSLCDRLHGVPVLCAAADGAHVTLRCKRAHM